MALQVTGNIKIGKAIYENLYIRLRVETTLSEKIILEAYGYESEQAFDLGQPFVASHPYPDVPTSAFPAKSGNIMAAVKFHAEAYVKADILARFPSVQVANV